MTKAPQPLLAAALSSVRFAGRRAAARFREPPLLDTLIVDVDRTITSEDSPKVALERMCGKDEAKKVFDGFVKRAIKGELKLDQIHSEVFGELYRRGFKRSDWVLIMQELERRGGLRFRLIDSLTRVASEAGLSTVLATRSSRDGAEWLARRFGFPFAVGSVENSSNGVFGGFSLMIGAADSPVNGTRVLTKMSAASELMKAAGRTLAPERTAVFSNDLLDALEMLRSARGILLVQDEPNTLERITYGLRLYDVTVRDGPNVADELRGALGLGRLRIQN
ncbi:MAG: HAD family hydrolase [Candidatus Micrarchaeota archaeon]